MPLGESFISSLKSNKMIMLDKTKRFRKTSGSYDWSKSQQFNFKKATPEQLKALRKRLKKENKLVRVKELIALLITMILIISVFVYFIF